MMKGAIDLSINMLVMIIISLIILGSGITLLYNFIGGAEDIKAELDQRTAQELERLLVDQGERVALPLHAATVLRGENHVFGIGILNIKNEATDFQIMVDLSAAFNKQDELIPANTINLNHWIFYDESTFSLESNEHRKEAILVTVPKNAESGKYVFVATVINPPCSVVDAECRYGNPQTFFVTVE